MLFHKPLTILKTALCVGVFAYTPLFAAIYELVFDEGSTMEGIQHIKMDRATLLSIDAGYGLQPFHPKGIHGVHYAKTDSGFGFSVSCMPHKSTKSTLTLRILFPADYTIPPHLTIESTVGMLIQGKGSLHSQGTLLATEGDIRFEIKETEVVETLTADSPHLDRLIFEAIESHDTKEIMRLMNIKNGVSLPNIHIESEQKAKKREVIHSGFIQAQNGHITCADADVENKPDTTMEGQTVTINRLTNYGSVTAYTLLTKRKSENHGTLTVQEALQAQSGFDNISGAMTCGSLQLGADSKNLAILTVQRGVTSDTFFTNKASGTMTCGSLQVKRDSNNEGKLTVTGAVTSDTRFTNKAGGTMTCGSLQVQRESYNEGKLTVTGAVTSDTRFTNKAGGTMTCGSLQVQRESYNEGTLIVMGALFSDERFMNKASGKMICRSLQVQREAYNEGALIALMGIHSEDRYNTKPQSLTVTPFIYVDKPGKREGAFFKENENSGQKLTPIKALLAQRAEPSAFARFFTIDYWTAPDAVAEPDLPPSEWSPVKERRAQSSQADEDQPKKEKKKKSKKKKSKSKRKHKKRRVLTK